MRTCFDWMKLVLSTNAKNSCKFLIIYVLYPFRMRYYIVNIPILSRLDGWFDREIVKLSNIQILSTLGFCGEVECTYLILISISICSFSLQDLDRSEFIFRYRIIFICLYHWYVFFPLAFTFVCSGEIANRKQHELLLVFICLIVKHTIYDSISQFFYALHYSNWGSEESCILQQF